MNDRNEKDFWAVWKPGADWPSRYASESSAKAAAVNMARQNIGITVHLMRVQSVGTVTYPDLPDPTCPK